MNKTIQLGTYTVNRIGLGTNRLRETSETRNLLKRAIELGINFIDTANIYQSGQSEQTIGSVLSPYPEDLVIATKGGMVSGSEPNNEPEYLRKCINESLERLKTGCIPLYQIHRLSPKTPVKTTMAFLNEMKKEGKIKYIGLSEVTTAQIEEARKTAEVNSVQNNYSLAEHKHDDVVDYCERNNIIFISYFPLRINDAKKAERIAKKYNAKVWQISLAWLLKRSKVMLPIPGTLSVSHLEENFESLDIDLSDEDFEALK
jgi:pyridoxine 4-dehydrogenase